uniref:Activating transcription factor 6 n=1 Tax=Neogobius melanostomus TaxID=47308 RepID=A0A8C6T7P4_9GOBI
MASISMSDLENPQHCPLMDNETGIISIDQGGEWDISLFDELENLGDADELLEALEHAGFANDGPNLDFDIDISPWSEVDTQSSCTDGELTVDSLSPAYTLSSLPSPSSVEALSPYSLHDEAHSPQSQPSPASICSESSGFSEAITPTKKAPRRTSQSQRVKPSQPLKRPIQCGPKVSIQPKPVITAVPLAHTAAPLQANTIIIQPLQTTVLSAVKPAPMNIQPAPPTGRPIVLSQAGQVLQIQTPQTLTANVVAMPTLGPERPIPVAAPPVVSVSLCAPSSDDDSKFSQRQQRMIKNRESASLSRKKKKEYLLTLEARLKLALSENEALKSENGTLKRQLQGLLSENTVLQTTAPKRRAVCLMVVLVFVMFNLGPTSLFQGGPGSRLDVVSTQHSGRHLLGISSEAESEVVLRPQSTGPSEMADSIEDKALMVPPVNRTKCIELAHKLRGWVHRHEVQQTKSRRMSNSNHKSTRTILVSHNIILQFTMISGSELQVYYAPSHTYSDFFDELNRRPDTFYVVSFRRDHLLLPATSHNKGQRPKMSLILPAINMNESIIRDKEFEVMMQIDCEVTDTKILHIRSSSIPPLLRVNRTDSFYQHSSSDNQPVPPSASIGIVFGTE